jgi:N-carbamoylputrescine amidase
MVEKMTMFKVALLQMLAHGNDQQANMKKGIDYCREAAVLGADLALFPEMWNIGYTGIDSAVWDSDFDPADPAFDEKRQSWQAQAIGSTDGFFVSFQELARELKMAIAITYLEEWPRQPRNSVSIIDRHGEIALTYAKVHTCDFSMESACSPGDEFNVCSLDTTSGPVTVGAMICFDREFPESARILMLKGAEIIVTPNACELEANRLGQFRARAYENMVGVAMANYASPQANGHSVAYDPMAFDDNEKSRDTLIIEAGEDEGIYLASFDLDAIRAYRRREVWGNAFRKPIAYGKLTSPEIEEPFVRSSSRR